ncbi:bidirectional sugar transporter nec1 [Phtheirospermum japonicum]|uniref:Bidirectional sugar transporter SWEET n=1 Tax=Phtheirospermum japonicum TaxID=374723 RepID=A0A830CVQ7_9LAMI|nr:bidirectional sugar transporter nec1 [Phtheirospermum japonicum]
MPTFYRIIKNKSTGGFQSIPYAVALFSAMLYLYYAFLKDKAIILITINTVGFFMEFTYLTIYMIYATRQSRVFTTKMLLLFNVSSLGIIIATTYFFAKGSLRLKIVGWICAIFSVSVFAAPLSIMRQVIKTKSVEFMPFSLSFFLTICSVVWFFYGFLISDYYIAAPNILGFTFGIVQMGLYAVYKNKKQNQASAEAKVHDIVVELKSLDHNHDNISEINPSNKHELEIEIVVLDCDEQVPAGIVVVQSKELP